MAIYESCGVIQHYTAGKYATHIAIFLLKMTLVSDNAKIETEKVGKGANPSRYSK